VPTLDQRFERSADFVVRTVADEHVLVPLRQQLPRGVLVVLLDGPVALRLWELLEPTALTGHELVDALTGEFDVDRPQAEEEVQAFLDQLLTLEAVSATDTPPGLTEESAED
jgi:hypothetical protein